MKTAILVTALCAAWPALAPAQACTRHSPAHTVALLELYTSEGCSSCPPADRHVSRLRGTTTPEQVVPLALHVDYWDALGWKDPFANRAFTERQRWLSKQAHSRVVYTPEVFVAGRELRGWATGTDAAIRRINAQAARADIAIASGKLAGGTLPLEVRAQSPHAGQLFVALYQNGLSSSVRAGENRGALLKHDYVVRDWIGPIALTPDGALHKAMLSRALALPAGAAAADLGIAAFVQDGQGTVLQATAMPLCGS